MRSVPYSPRDALRVIALAAIAMLSLTSEPRSQPRIVPLSLETTADILANHSAEINASDDDATTDFQLILVNSTGNTGFWLLKTEVLWPIAFTIRTEPAGEVIFRWDTSYLHQPTRASQGPELVSTPIVLEAGQQLALTAIFEHPPQDRMFPISAIPAADYTHELALERLVHGLYFGAQILFVVFFLVFSRVLSSHAARSFALYLSVLAILNAHSHGYLSQLTDLLGTPYFPLFRVLQVCAILAYLNFAMAFLNGQRPYPRFTRMIRVYLVVFAVGLAIEMTQGFPWLSALAGITFLLAGIAAAYLALRDRLDGSWYFSAGFVTLLVVGVVNFLASDIRDPVDNDWVDGLTLFLQLCDAGIFSAAIVAQTSGLRRARDQAQEAQLQEYRARVALNERLQESRTETARARALAEQHRAHLAATGHDLRQPLASLRVSLSKAQEVAPGLADDLSAGIDFLDSVLGETLTDTRPDPEAPEPDIEPVPVQIVLDNVHRMFAAEAAEKGLDLRTVPTGLQVQIAAIDLIRIVSNLVGNAVKYTATGTVLIGVRRRGGAVDIEIWDTGPGIPDDDIATILDAYRRGTAPTDIPGEGLGLSIARDLATRNGCAIRVCSHPGKGSVFSVSGVRIVRPHDDQR